MIELQNISKSYGNFEAVKDVNFTVNAGEIVGLLGPNGAGKTTLMKIITGYHNAHMGSTKICGIDVMENPVGAKKHIGYLPEANPLYEDLTVYEYLEFMARTHGTKDKEISDVIDKVIKTCSITDFAHKLISSLSKGMKQRVGLAQAIIHNPDVIILDEPTSGLDPNQIKEIRSVIRELGKTKTVILSTHILQEVEILCSRIFILNKGNIVAEGTNAEIAAKLKGEDVFEVFFASKVKENIWTNLKKTKGVDTVVEETKDNFTKLLITGKSSELQGEDIFDWAVTHKLKIRELYKKSASLESIFQSITEDVHADSHTSLKSAGGTQ